MFPKRSSEGWSSVFGEVTVGVWKSGHILFAVFRLPFGCKIPPHHRRNIINAKKITLTDGRKQPTRTRTPTRTPMASKRTPASREPCAVFRLSVSRARVSASDHPHTHPTHTHHPTQKQPPKRQAKPPPKTAEKPTQNGGKNNPKKGGYNAPKTHRPKSREL